MLYFLLCYLNTNWGNNVSFVQGKSDTKSPIKSQGKILLCYKIILLWKLKQLRQVSLLFLVNTKEWLWSESKQSTTVFCKKLIINLFWLQVVRDILLLGHRQAFAWIDEWIGGCHSV